MPNNDLNASKLINHRPFLYNPEGVASTGNDGKLTTDVTSLSQTLRLAKDLFSETPMSSCQTIISQLAYYITQLCWPWK